jgi:hypothetical protein
MGYVMMVRHAALVTLIVDCVLLLLLHVKGHLNVQGEESVIMVCATVTVDGVALHVIYPQVSIIFLSIFCFLSNFAPSFLFARFVYPPFSHVFVQVHQLWSMCPTTTQFQQSPSLLRIKHNKKQQTT